MTKVVIKAGSCGFTATVTAEKGPDRRIRLTIDSDCETVRKMQADLAELDRMDAFKRILDNPVYRSANKHLKHTACPVPSGILKTLEAEAGMNLARDAVIEFVAGEGKKAEKD